MKYTLALDCHKELQQHGSTMEFAGEHEVEYRNELEKELARTFGGEWEIISEMGESELPDEADYDSLNEVFARAAETVMI